jgi:ferredoxin
VAAGGPGERRLGGGLGFGRGGRTPGIPARHGLRGVRRDLPRVRGPAGGAHRNPEDCPVLHTEDFAGYIEALHELLGAAAALAPAMHIDPDKCNGCGICVAMCEYHLGNCPEARLGRGPRPQDQVVFQVVNGTVVVVRQELCVRLVQAAEKCSKCAEHCPTEAITFF